MLVGCGQNYKRVVTANLFIYLFYFIYTQTISIHFITKQILLFDAYTETHTRTQTVLSQLCRLFGSRPDQLEPWIPLEITPWFVDTQLYRIGTAGESTKIHYIHKYGKKYVKYKALSTLVGIPFPVQSLWLIRCLKLYLQFTCQLHYIQCKTYTIYTHNFFFNKNSNNFVIDTFYTFSYF